METQTITESDSRLDQIEQHLTQVRAVSARIAEIRRGAEQLTDEEFAAENEGLSGGVYVLASMKFDAVEKMLGLLATLRSVPGDTRITVRTRLGEVHLVRSFEQDGDDDDSVPRRGYTSVGFFEGAFHGLVCETPAPRLWRVLRSSDQADTHLTIYHVAGDSVEPERVAGVDLEWISCLFDDDQPLWDLVVGQSEPGACQ